MTRTYFKPPHLQKAFYGGTSKGFYLRKDGPNSFWLCYGTDNGSSAMRVSEETYRLLQQACKIERQHWRTKEVK